jgi:hypothetical protein
MRKVSLLRLHWQVNGCETRWTFRRYRSGSVLGNVLIGVEGSVAHLALWPTNLWCGAARWLTATGSAARGHRPGTPHHERRSNSQVPLNAARVARRLQPDVRPTCQEGARPPCARERSLSLTFPHSGDIVFDLTTSVNQSSQLTLGQCPFPGSRYRRRGWAQPWLHTRAAKPFRRGACSLQRLIYTSIKL